MKASALVWFPKPTVAPAKKMTAGEVEEEPVAADPLADVEQRGEEDEEEEKSVEEDPNPVGDVIRVSGEGTESRKHYHSFAFDGNQYHLEDPVLLVPEEQNQKPKMAIIKDIIETADGSMTVAGYMFYRPNEAQLRNGRFEQPHSTREVFYSFHRNEFPAKSVMHKFVAHFIPLNRQIPPRIQHPGFIVQWVYNTKKRRLFELTHKHYSDNKRKEIDLLIQKTESRLKDLSGNESEYCVTGQKIDRR